MTVRHSPWRNDSAPLLRSAGASSEYATWSGGDTWEKVISKLRDMEEEERVYDSRLCIRDFTDARVHLPYSEFGAPSRLMTVANPTAHFTASSSTTRRRLAVRVRGVEEPNSDGDVRCEVEDETGSLTATVSEDMTHWYVWKSH